MTGRTDFASILRALNKGDHTYVETAADRASYVMRQLNPPVSRRHRDLRDRVFKTTSWVAVHGLETKVLVRVERLE